MKDKDYFKEIKEIEKFYTEIITTLDLTFPKCINLQEEKRKFFTARVDDKFYNPQLKFIKKDFDEKIIEKLNNFKINTFFDKYGIKKLYKERLEEIKNEIKYQSMWGNSQNTKYIIKCKGIPSRKLLKKAQKFAKEYQRVKVRFERLTPRKIGNALKNYVKELTGDEVKVEYFDMPSKVNIEPALKLIQINPNERFTSLDLDRLKAHEIDVHYMRYFNGRNSGIKLLENGTAQYLKTEEGIAVFNEDREGVLSKAQMFIYAGRVIATYYCLTKSFFEIFEILKEHNFPDRAAFMITYRAKRNLCDTSQLGGFTKDYVYFEGYLIIKEYSKNHDINELMMGKIKLEDLKKLKKFKKKLMPEVVTSFSEETQEDIQES
ncbi:MAG: tyrosine/phenylalanine carboxypeptidase domain-containing protein [Nanoarchaeota archaeon]